MSDLENAAKFLAGYAPPPPPRGYAPPPSWDVCLGAFELPDGVWDAREASLTPPVHPLYPHPTIAYVRHFSGWGWELRHCLRSEDGRWLELVWGDGG